jgi:RHS repeat-associated protein
VTQLWGSTWENPGLQALYSYDPYGNRSAEVETVSSDIGFAGYLHRTFYQASLDFAEHRVYSAQYGRWLNRDPIGHAGGTNLYRYVDNDPVSLSDPSGNCPWCIGAAAGALAGGAVGYYTSSGSWATAGEYTVLGAVAGGSGAALGVLAGGGSLVEALGIGTTLAGGTIAQDGEPEITFTEISAGNLITALNQLYASKPNASGILRDFFAANSEGGDINITPGITDDLLSLYRHVALLAINTGKDTQGVQAERLDMIDKALGNGACR